MPITEKEFNEFTDVERFNRSLRGTLYYTEIHKANTSLLKTTETRKWKGLPYYGTSLGLDAENQKRAESFGLTIQEPNDNTPEPHVILRRKVKPDKTEEECRPELVDSMQNPIPSHILIGNGSKGIVKFATYWFDNNDGGVGNALLKIQVTELVPYSVDGDEFVMDKGGFTVGDSPTPTSNDLKDDDIPDFEVSKQPAKKAVGATNTDIFDD